MVKTEKDCCSEKNMCCRKNYSQTGPGAIYGLGVVGALVYFVQNASGISMVVVGIVKAFFWPAILMYELLSFLSL